MAQQQFVVELGYKASTLRYKRVGTTAGYIGQNAHGGASYVVEAESEEAAINQLGWLNTWGQPRPDYRVRPATEAEIIKAQQFTAELIEAQDVFQSQLRESKTTIWQVNIDMDGADGLGLMQNEALTIHQTRETFHSDGAEFLVAATTAQEAEDMVIEFLASQTVKVEPASDRAIEEFRQQVEACTEAIAVARKTF